MSARQFVKILGSSTIITTLTSVKLSVLHIFSTYETKGLKEAKALAGQIIDEAYGYQFGPVLFKPSLSHHRHSARLVQGR